MGAAEKQIPSIADRLDELPTLPSIVYELSRVIGDPMSSTSDIEKIMANDQSMTTKVLRLANSAYYAIPGGVSTLSRAIAYIGYDTIHQLVLSASIVDALGTRGIQQFGMTDFWKHSLGVAMAAEVIGKKVSYKNATDLFTCGLVHDMGKIAIYIVAPEIFLETLNCAKEKGISLFEAEDLLGHPKHTQVGGQLANKWRLPVQLQAVTQFHHHKETSLRMGLSIELNLAVDIIFLANLLIHALQFGNSGHSQVLGVPKILLERLHLSQDQLAGLASEIKDKLKNADAFLKIIGG
jgi:HD-like signal output (HDOD) protein